MPSTFVHGLLPSGCLVTLRKRLPKLTRLQTLKLAFVAAIIGNFPDLDVIPGTIFHEHWEQIHREWGHNIFSVCFLIFLGTVLIKKFVSRDFTRRALWLISGSLVASHLFLDSMAHPRPDGVPSGVPLLWPFTNHSFSFPIRLFHCYAIDEQKNRLVAHATSLEYWTHAVWEEVVATVVLFSLWMVGLLLFAAVERRLARRKNGLKLPAENAEPTLESLSQG